MTANHNLKGRPDRLADDALTLRTPTMGTERLVEELKKYRAHELVMQDFEKWSDRYKAALDEFNSELEVAGRRATMKIQKTKAADNNFGHYGRSAMLTYSRNATWGVFRNGEQIAQIQQEMAGGGAWNVESHTTYRRIAQRGFQSAKQAKEWALEHLQDGVAGFDAP